MPAAFAPRKALEVGAAVEAAALRLKYDPGILDEYDLAEDLLAAIRGKRERAKSITESVIRVNDGVVSLGTILF